MTGLHSRQETQDTAELQVDVVAQCTADIYVLQLLQQLWQP